MPGIYRINVALPDPLCFNIRFANIGTNNIDIVEVYMAPSGGIYGDNLLPVEALKDGEYFALEELDRWRNYNVKVVFDLFDSATGANHEVELLNNPPVYLPADCVSWYGLFVKSDFSVGYPKIEYSMGCEGEYPYDLVEE